MNCTLLSYKNWVIKIYNYSSMELLSFNWMCKHIKKIRSSYDFARTDSCTEFSVSHWVSVLALKKQTQHLFKLGPPPIIVLKKPLFQKKRKSYKTCSNFVLVSLRQNWLLRPWKLCFSDFHLLITFVQKLTFLLNVPKVAYSNLWHRKIVAYKCHCSHHTTPTNSHMRDAYYSRMYYVYISNKRTAESWITQPPRERIFKVLQPVILEFSSNIVSWACPCK